LGGAVVVDGHDHDLVRRRAVVGGNRNPRRRDLGGPDPQETRTDELTEIAFSEESFGGIGGVVIKPLIVGVQVEYPPKDIGVEVVVHDAVVDLVGVFQPAGDAGVIGGEIRYLGFPTFNIVPRRRGIACRDGIGATSI
jgi:hypothetical protein